MIPSELNKEKMMVRDEYAVFSSFAEEHSQEQFSVNRSAGLGAAGVCAAIALTLIQTQIRTVDAVASIIFSCIAIPLFVLSSGINEYFLFLGEKAYGFYTHIRIYLRLINGFAGLLLIISFACAAHSLSPTASYALLIAAVIAVVGFRRFHQKLGSWIAKDATDRIDG